MRLFCYKQIVTIDLDSYRILNLIQQVMSRKARQVIREEDAKSLRPFASSLWPLRCKMTNRIAEYKIPKLSGATQQKKNSSNAAWYKNKKELRTETLPLNPINPPKSTFRLRLQTKFRNRRSLMHLDFEM